MIRASVNAEPVELADGATVADVIGLLGADPRGIAVALDREVVPRSQWATTVIPERARIEVVTAAAGG